MQNEKLPEVVTALLFDAEGRLLIYLRDDKLEIPFPGFWDLFGGYVDPGETLEEALVREIQEELGVSVGEVTFFKRYECLTGDARPNTKHVYAVELPKDAQEPVLHEGQRLERIHLADRHKYRFANILGSILDDYVQEGIATMESLKRAEMDAKAGRVKRLQG